MKGEIKVSDRPKKLLVSLVLSAILLTGLTACGSSGQTRAQERIFLNLSLDFLGEYQLPQTTFKDTPVGGLSAITYHKQTSRFYALSDDRSKLAPARFYTLNLVFNQTEGEQVGMERVDIEDVTFLTDEQGQTYPKGSLDPEGIAISARGTAFVASEGVSRRGIAPFIREFDLKTGQEKENLKLPEPYLPNPATEKEEAPRGVQNNRGFESLTLSQTGLAKDDPFRLFAATEASLFQDASESQQPERIRLLHYVIGPIGSPIPVAEHLYLLEKENLGKSGLSELTTIGQGFFLSLERSYDLSGLGAKIYQVVVGNATDTSSINSLKGNLDSIEPLKKKLLLDLGELGIELNNLEGMTLGPRLPDGSQSLVLVSDNNFDRDHATQFLLFRLVKRS